MSSPKTATEIDIYVGRKLKHLRRMKELSQTDLGRATNVSFQQIQKYERGLNRISVGRLWEFCEVFKVSPTYFFDGFNTVGNNIEAAQPIFVQSAE